MLGAAASSKRFDTFIGITVIQPSQHMQLQQQRKWQFKLFLLANVVTYSGTYSTVLCKSDFSEIHLQHGLKNGHIA